MWHDERDATNASSGSTPLESDQGAGTMCGLGLAGTVTPPSNSHSCARLYRPLAKSAPASRVQRTVAVYVLIGDDPVQRIDRTKQLRQTRQAGCSSGSRTRASAPPGRVRAVP